MVCAKSNSNAGLFRLGLGLGLGRGLDLAVILLLVGSVAAASSDQVASLRARRLQDQHDFKPNRCTVGRCQPWTSVFGSKTVYKERIVVDCAVCITMDHSNFRLEDGIDIRGRLEIPDGTTLQMETTGIVVQGELMMSATQPVDGSASVIITMIGEDDAKTFEVPHDPRQCQTGASGCKIGQKGIVVAGGSINLTGMPAGSPTWVPLYDVSGRNRNNPNTLIVSNKVLGSWAPGAEILITSHTTEWNRQTTRSIVSVSRAAQSGYVEIELDRSIARPTTAREEADFAVEIALLSRNIVLEAQENGPIGGHLEIRRTSANKQYIDGVEIRNFGQAGVKGRYPIHTHFCGDLDGSVISRNTVRQSNQRCVVVHGTNKLRVEGNIAFDTKGHCFMTEDGVETENHFINNLGAKTGAAIRLIDDTENDDEPATFWMTNPTNYYVGNVAAGSEDSGFWFDAKKRGARAYLFPDLDPFHDHLLAFDGNVAHSNMSKQGAVRTYKPGYLPHKDVVFSGLRIYRNVNAGLVLHKCHNIIVRNSIFADNGRALDIDRADGITVENVVIIGESQSFRDVMGREPGIASGCFHQRVIGLDLHTWKLHKQFGGAVLRNIHFAGFTNTACRKPSPIWMDGLNLRDGQFELYSSFKDITFEDSAKKIDFCHAEAKGVTASYLVDLDGSLRTAEIKDPSSPSVLLGSDPLMMKFVDRSSCTQVPSGCYSYCPDICFRSYRYELDASGTENYQLKVCRVDKRNNNCALFPGSQRGPRENRLFVAHMPTGFDYVTEFVNAAGNEVEDVPLLFEQYEEDLCREQDSFSVTLV